MIIGTNAIKMSYLIFVRRAWTEKGLYNQPVNSKNLFLTISNCKFCCSITLFPNDMTAHNMASSSGWCIDGTSNVPKFGNLIVWKPGNRPPLISLS